MISLRVARGNFATHFQLPSKSRVSPLKIPMSTLAKDAAAFKSALARQDYTSWHSNPGPPKVAGDAGGEEPGEKKKKKKPKNSEYHSPPLPGAGPNVRVLDVVYSQPADTGTGINVNTQLVYAVAHLKV